MQYSGHATEQDHVSEIRKLSKSNTTTYPINDLTRRFNFALHRYFHLAFESDGRWKFDDANQTDVALETLNIVAGTNKYDMSTLTSELFQLFRIEFLDANSLPILGTPESLKELEDPFTTIYTTASDQRGTPDTYLKWGDFLYIRKCPNYSLSAGIKFFFNRKASLMVATDTTKVPGIPIMHEEYVDRVAAHPYIVANLSANQIVANQNEIDKWEVRIKKHYATRDEDAGLKQITGETVYPV